MSYDSRCLRVNRMASTIPWYDSRPSMPDPVFDSGISLSGFPARPKHQLLLSIGNPALLLIPDMLLPDHPLWLCFFAFNTLSWARRSAPVSAHAISKITEAETATQDTQQRHNAAGVEKEFMQLTQTQSYMKIILQWSLGHNRCIPRTAKQLLIYCSENRSNIPLQTAQQNKTTYHQNRIPNQKHLQNLIMGI